MCATCDVLQTLYNTLEQKRLNSDEAARKLEAWKPGEAEGTEQEQAKNARFFAGAEAAYFEARQIVKKTMMRMEANTRYK